MSTFTSLRGATTHHYGRPRPDGARPAPRSSSRATDDRSHGWGHNSQWSTDFRRDHLADGRLHYNVEAALRPDDREEEDLDPASMIELVRHRCSTVVDHGGDLYPYRHHHVEPAPACCPRLPSDSGR
ncbi:hypothetical protein HNP84_010209 [Thermocatellispora tengchongensis]|uniref:Uncharacterized protein n=1 Tax=Thermocatellispora tengchongensis TaxID=1073253 RepID=A0A840PN24_9ACTN|nr:hypothetical protein [Thermocatellispora tengchongensis]MBB5140442.1 hypothetical protein [Thermocatellispora tengchongensis]